MTESREVRLDAAIDRGYAAWETASNCHEPGCGCVTEWIKREVRAALSAPATPTGEGGAQPVLSGKGKRT